MLLDQNHDFLEVNCTQAQVPSLLIRSDPQSSFHPHFKYFVFSLPSPKLKFFRGSSCQTPGPPSKKKCGLDFDSPFSVSNEEVDRLRKSNGLEDHSLKDPLESDLNDLF